MRLRYLNVTNRPDGQTICCGNTALYVASRGKNGHVQLQQRGASNRIVG